MYAAIVLARRAATGIADHQMVVCGKDQGSLAAKSEMYVHLCCNQV